MEKPKYVPKAKRQKLADGGEATKKKTGFFNEPADKKKVESTSSHIKPAGAGLSNNKPAEKREEKATPPKYKKKAVIKEAGAGFSNTRSTSETKKDAKGNPIPRRGTV
jgi:hypothetical protein